MADSINFCNISSVSGFSPRYWIKIPISIIDLLGADRYPSQPLNIVGECDATGDGSWQLENEWFQ